MVFIDNYMATIQTHALGQVRFASSPTIYRERRQTDKH